MRPRENQIASHENGGVALLQRPLRHNLGLSTYSIHSISKEET
jgi:hypothetical protein